MISDYRRFDRSGCQSLSSTCEFITDIHKELDGSELAVLEAPTQIVGYAEHYELWGILPAARRLADSNAT